MDKNPTDHVKDKNSSGVAETGVLIRKTSIRRRISKDDTSEDKSYGNKTEEYDKICEKVMSDPGVQKTLEAMQEKWRMIMFMYEDCMELRKGKQENDQLAKSNKLKRDFIALVITYVLITVPVIIAIYLTFLFVIWFVTTAG